MTAWEVYYDDGSTITGCLPEEVKPFGIVCIAQKHSQKSRCLMHGWDFYYWHEEDEQWWGCDLQGLLDRLLHRLPVRALLQGRTVDNETYQNIMARADFEHLDWLNNDPRNS